MRHGRAIHATCSHSRLCQVDARGSRYMASAEYCRDLSILSLRGSSWAGRDEGYANRSFVLSQSLAGKPYCLAANNNGLSDQQYRETYGWLTFNH
nr:hypothetical protein CFP56_13022 [Quercus suber]